MDSKGIKDPVILLHTSGYSSDSHVHLGLYGSLFFPKKPVYGLSISPLSRFTSLTKNHNEKCNERAKSLPEAHGTMQILNPPPSIRTATPPASPFLNPLPRRPSPPHTDDDICPPQPPPPLTHPPSFPLSILEGRFPPAPVSTRSPPGRTRRRRRRAHAHPAAARARPAAPLPGVEGGPAGPAAAPASAEAEGARGSGDGG